MLSSKRRWNWTKFRVLSVMVVALATVGYAQQQLPIEVEHMGYADSVFLNGKIVSMDDASISTNPGTIYQALAVKGDKIMKLGTNDQVKAMAGRETKSYDLKGRTMLPGIVEPHQHIYGGAMRYADRFGIKWPPNGIQVSVTADKDLEKTNRLVKDTISDAVKKVKPGDWVFVQLRAVPGDPAQVAQWGYTRRLNDKKALDTVSPNNPVLVQPGNRGNVNSAALKVLNEVMPGYSASIQESMHGVDIGEDIPAIGWVGSQEMASIQWEVLMRTIDNSTLAQMLKLVSESWASIGVTTFGTRLPMPKVMSGYAKLQEMGQMPIRMDAHYEVHRAPADPAFTRVLYAKTGVLQGIGGDYMWFDGVASERWDSHTPEACLGPDAPAPANIKARETCPHEGDMNWDVLQNAVRSGWRLTGVHMVGSDSLRRMKRMIEQVIKEGLVTKDQVRAMQFSFEHCDGIGKRPDIIEILKDFNFFISCGPDYIGQGPTYVKDYGPTNPNILDIIVPFNTWIKSGVHIVGQHFGGGTLGGGEGGGAGFQPPFFMLWQTITRKWDGRVWQPEERIDRVHAMKMWSRWAADYVRKPDKVGSLEVGKWADLLVIDRDYFTVPEDDILKIRPLMTVVGGKTVTLNASLAKEWNIEPVGNQFNFEDKQLEWIGKPISDAAKKAAAAE